MMMEALRPDLDLLGSFPRAPDPPISVQVRDRFAEFREFLSLSLPAKSTSGTIPAGDDHPIRSASPVSDELSLSLSLSSPAESVSRSVGQDRAIGNFIPKQDSSQPNFSGFNTLSSSNFRFRVSWGSKNRRNHALKPRRNPNHQKPPIPRPIRTRNHQKNPPICPIRACNHQKPPIYPIRAFKRSRPTKASEKALLLKEEIAAQGLLMLANQNPWKITKILTESDLNLQSRLLISRSLVEEHILPNLDQESREKVHSKDGLNVRVRDCDTDDKLVLELKIKWWNSSRSYNFQGGWRKNFVGRRNLCAGDRIGLFWSRADGLFVFSVLQRAKLGAC